MIPEKKTIRTYNMHTFLFLLHKLKCNRNFETERIFFMENYQMGRSCGRPYRTTCGMNRMPAPERMPMPERMPATERMPMPDKMSAPERKCMSDEMSQKSAGQCECQRKSSCNCHMPGMIPKEAALYEKADMLPPAMGYVPCQKLTRTFDLCYALQVGTIFPELCKPFCGKRGVRR